MPAPVRIKEVKADSFLANLRRYPSRKSVADAAFNARQPFTMKQLLLHLKRTNARTSKATAYRTIALLVENRILQEPIIHRDELIYCPAVKEDELLWICSDCGKASRSPGQSIDRTLRANAESQGLHLDLLTVHVRSTCRNKQSCRNSQSPENILSEIWP